MNRSWSRHLALLALAALLATTASVAGPVETAHAAARVTVTNELGTGEADTSYSTEISVAGSGFQSVPGAFGGVYVAFGTVEAGWRPSKGGVSGVDFRYVPDSESQDNAGFQRYVAFPGSSTSREAHATMSDGGAWTVTMTVPGPTFQTTGRSGRVETVDCRRVTCGVITFGAHGVTNANNETFTPVRFADIYSDRGDEDQPASDDGGADEGTVDDGAEGDGAGGDDAVDATAPSVEPGLEVDGTTAVVGRVMTFTARGFEAGEQVVGSLGAGLAAVGPLVAGAHGEVAGAIQLPTDLRAGTHVLVLTGAATGVRLSEQLQVGAAPAVEQDGDGRAGQPSWEWVALGAAALILLVVIAVGVITAVRDRRRGETP